MRPKIAVVRGHYFSRDEIAFYAPLKDDFDITFISGIKGSAGIGNNPAVVEVKSFNAILSRTLPTVTRRILGFWGNLSGVDADYLFGLESTLRGFDLVQSMDYDYTLTYQLARIKAKLGFKLSVLHWENIPFARDHKPICKHAKKRVYHETDGFFAMSERAKASLMLEGVESSKIFLIGWGVDPDEFKPDEEAGKAWRTRLGIGEDEVVILFIGRVRASKGVFDLIYATKRLVTDSTLAGKRIRVVIAGRGPAEKQVARKRDQLGLHNYITMVGAVPHNEIQGLHNIADIFCVPSAPRKYWQEQLGMVFLEAMACEKPVVSTLSGSIPEVLGEAGILVQPSDHTSLYGGLKDLVVDEKKRRSLAQDGRRRVTANFTVEAVSHRIKDAFTSILQNYE